MKRRELLKGGVAAAASALLIGVPVAVMKSVADETTDLKIALLKRVNGRTSVYGKPQPLKLDVKHDIKAGDEFQSEEAVFDVDMDLDEVVGVRVYGGEVMGKPYASVANFPSGPLTVRDGDILKVTYTISASNS